MILERTLHLLQTHTASAERAEELGRMGFMQWLGGLIGKKGYPAQAAAALRAADAFRKTDPAVEVFCVLIEASLEMPPHPLDLALPRKRRRGGARSRRQMI